ncbi:MAG: hypothetical protein DCF29_03110 [Alphaproteobacteria bacterium]|nr:MAG: hypothetical protein DCF29_03110 [Alphaproteobacteria bacterium]
MGRLTRREIECVQLAGLRLSNQEIADVLGITPSTVANYLQSANAKLGTSHRRAAAQALGIQYPGAGMTDAELAERLPQRLRPAVSRAWGTRSMTGPGRRASGDRLRRTGSSVWASSSARRRSGCSYWAV